MTAYNPPEFQFTGLIFNPLIYEQGEGTTSSNTFTDLTTDNLNTNNIQGKTAGANITLYTLSTALLTLGSTLLTEIYIRAQAINTYSDIFYMYEKTAQQLVSYVFAPLTRNIYQRYYADVGFNVINVSLEGSPSTSGDLTNFNGIYIIRTGTTRLINLLSTSLEAPNHYLYNKAKTMYKHLFYGAGGNIYETYYADTTTSTSTANATISPFVAGNTTIDNGNFAITSGSFQAISKRFTQMESVRHNLYNVAKTLYKSVFYGASTTINEEFYADSSNPTIATVTTFTAPIGGTPTIANTGTYQITSGTTTFESSVAINLGTTMGASGVISVGSTAMSSLNINKPLTPNYDSLYNATNGAGANTNVGYVYSRVGTSGGNFAIGVDVLNPCLNLTLVDVGVYLLLIDNNVFNSNSSGIITLYYQQISIGTSALGADIYSVWLNAYAQINNATSPNQQLHSPFSYIYTNTTANRIIYTNMKCGRSGAGLNWSAINSFIKAVRIA